MIIEIYTDGAVNYGNVGWGFVALHKGNTPWEYCGKLNGDPELLAQRNVAGEMAAVLRALSWVKRQIKKGEFVNPEIRIIHDYSGCAAWPNGKWKAKNKYTQRYSQYVNKCRKQFKVTFRLIKGHNKNKSEKDNHWNDRADLLAKAGAKKK